MHSTEVENLVLIKGVQYPEGVDFRQILVTGPPGCGKTSLMTQIGGWPEEGYLDLGQKNWWRSPILTFRPREIHFGIPFYGHDESLTVFEPAWLESPTPIDFRRIRSPKEDPGLLRTDWREKYVFDFLLPNPEIIYEKRQERISEGSFPVDKNISLEQIRIQVSVYEELAVFFHQQGWKVFIRNSFGGAPRTIEQG